MLKKRHHPFSSEEFKAIYSRVPRLTVEVIVKLDNGVALIKRQEPSWHGQWHIPGGTVLYKETIEQAVKRLAQEELGIQVKMQSLIGYIEYPSEEKERGFGWSIGMAFFCEAVNEIDWEQWQKEGIEVFENLPKNVVEEQRMILEKVLSNQ